MSLNKAQKEAVSQKDGPCLVLAGPGSGKTLTLTKRIEYLIQIHRVRPEEILVITFTKYAAGEMRDRFRAIRGMEGRPVTFGTFHGIYYGILKHAYGWKKGSFLMEEEKRALLKEILSGEEWGDMLPDGGEEDLLTEFAEEIAKVKNNRYDIRTYECLKYGSDRFRKAYLLYEERKKALGKVDFEDMLLLCYALFQERPDILRKWQEKFRYILVDEFQDINQVQYDVLRLLAAPRDNLFVVGDDDQSVYCFRGAKPEIMHTFLEDYPDAVRIVLDINYRSTAHIVDSAARVIRSNKRRQEKSIRAHHPARETVHVQEVRDPIEESKYVVSKYREYVKRGVKPSEMAVLYRTATDARILAETFMEYQIPFHMKEHVGHIYEHFICTDMCCYLRLATGSYVRGDLVRIANRPKRYVGRDSMAEEKVTYESLRAFYSDKEWMQERIGQLEQDMEAIRGKTPYAAVWYIRKSVGYEGFLKEYAAYRGLEEEGLFSVLEELQERLKEFRTLEEWLSHVEECKEALKRREPEKEEKEGVELLTIHRAKGLEYEVVFIIQANEGGIPYKKAATEEEIEEERRLFYVAMTRAKQKLIISYVKEKNGKSKSPSRFMDELLFSV